MKRLTIFGIVVCVGLLVGSAKFIAIAAGPPSALDVNVTNEPTVHVGTMPEVIVNNQPGVTVENLPSAPVPVTMTDKVTHMGVPPSDHVELRLQNDKEYFYRRQSNGYFEADPFEVPEGKMFVVTDFRGYATGATPGQYVQLRYDRRIPQNGSYYGVELYSLFGIADVVGEVWFTGSHTSGIVCKSGEKFILGPYTMTPAVIIYMYGYLVDSNE